MVLIVGAYQAKVVSDIRAESAKPYLAIERYKTLGNELGVNAINKGLGPTIIKQIDVLIDG